MQKKYFWLIAILLVGLASFYFQKASVKQMPEKIVPAEHEEESEAGYGKSVNTTLIDSSEYLINIQNIGPVNATGRITCLAISETDSNHILAGADWGGRWISDNRGTTWQPVNDFAPTLRTTSLVQNHFQQNEYYYSTGVNKFNNGILLHDIYRSVNGGYTFIQVSPTTNPVIGSIDKIICSPVDSNTIYFFQRYAVNNTIGSLYRTTNKFTSFQKVFQPSGGVINDYTVLQNGEVIVTSSNKIWQSATGDPGTYILSNSGLPGTLVNISVAACKNQPLIRYATGSGAIGNSNMSVYRSVDGGNTWAFLSNLTITSNAGRTFIAVKPDNPDIIFIAGVNLTGSINGGTTWRPVYAGWDYMGIQFDPNRASIGFYNSDSGVQSVEMDQMSSPTLLLGKKYNNTLLVQDVEYGDHSSTGNMTMAGLWDIGSHITMNNGTSNFVSGGDGMNTYCSKQDPNKAYCSTQGGTMLRLSNALTSPNYQVILNELDADGVNGIDEGAAFINPYIMNDADDKQLYIPTLQRLWRSTNGGNNWAPVSKYYGNTFYRLALTASKKVNPIVYWTNVDSVFVFGSAATAAPLTDFGMPVPADPEKIYVDPQNDSCIFLLKKGLPSGIFHSSNMFQGNVQWTDIGINFPMDVTPMCITSYPGNGQVLLVGSFEGGIYITIDGGQTWTKEKHFPNVRISEIKIRESDKNIFIFTHGRGVWSAKLDLPIIPLTLLSFNATANDANKKAMLTWNTSAEINTRSFGVERSFEGRNFVHIEFMNASGQGDHIYHTSVQMKAPIEYYRLKMIDIDGRFTYSDIVKVKLSKAGDGLLILTNPVKEKLVIEVLDKELANTTAVLVDNLGRIVFKFLLHEGRQEVSIGNLSAGTYYLRAGIAVKKILISK
ncbi:MAG: hypothetical protein ABI741_14880 [Ferruginibacter sp.]